MATVRARIFCFLVLLSWLSAGSAQIIFGRRPTPPPSPSPAASDLGSSCLTPEDRPGVCGLVTKCASLTKHLKNRNIAYLKASLCGRHGSTQLLCCPDGVTAQFVSPKNCGVSQLDSSHIVGGFPVRKLGDFPWMAALGYRSKPVFKCGGAVINSRWILTAAHCLTRDGPISARVGDLNLVTPIDDDVSSPPQNIEIEKAIRHPEFSGGFIAPNKGLINDIAVLKVKTLIAFSHVVRPICLPSTPETVNIADDHRLLIAGWGLTEFGGIGSVAMQHDVVNTTQPAACRNAYATVGVRVDDRLHVCAGDNLTGRNRALPGCEPGSTEIRCQGSADACGGDSGGPLMAFRNEDGVVRMRVLGVASFAVGCGNATFPGIYTRVEPYMDWIGQTIAEN